MVAAKPVETEAAVVYAVARLGAIEAEADNRQQSTYSPWQSRNSVEVIAVKAAKTESAAVMAVVVW
jgi:hypothetical protein